MCSTQVRDALLERGIQRTYVGNRREHLGRRAENAYPAVAQDGDLA
jgi:hypothetical protein